MLWMQSTNLLWLVGIAPHLFILSGCGAFVFLNKVWKKVAMSIPI